MEAEIDQAIAYFEWTDSLEDLNKIVEITTQAIDSYGQGADSELLNKLGFGLQLLFDRELQPDQLDRAVWALRQAVERTTADNPRMPKYLNNLGRALWARWEEQHNDKDLKEATRSLRSAAHDISVPYPTRAGYLQDLSDILCARYRQPHIGCDPEEAIDCLRQAAGSQPISENEFADLADNLSFLLQKRAYMSPHRLDDLDEAITWSERVSGLEHLKNLEDWPVYLNTLSMALLSRYWISHRSGDVDRAIEWAANALQGLSKDHGNYSIISKNLADALQAKWEAEGCLEDLDETIDRYHECVETTDCDDSKILKGTAEDVKRSIHQFKLAKSILSQKQNQSYLPRLLSNLSNAYRLAVEIDSTLSKKSGKVVRDAIEAAERAVQLTPKGFPDLGSYLYTLTSALLLDYDRNGNGEALTVALTKAREAKGLAPAGCLALGTALGQLSIVLQKEFKRTGKLELLDEAIEIAKRSLVPRGESRGYADRCNNLGNALVSRFEWKGSSKAHFGDLNEAVKYLAQAIEVRKNSRSIVPSAYYGNSGLALHIRHDRTGSREDLGQAIDLLEMALNLDTSITRALPGRNSNLSRALFARSRLGGSEAKNDLDRAIKLAQTAVDTSSPEDTNIWRRHNNLGVALRTRYQGPHGTPEDFDSAVEHLERAVEKTLETDPARVGYLNNLGLTLQSKFEITGESGERLREAIRCFEQCVKDTNHDHPLSGGFNMNLSSALGILYQESLEPNDLERAVAYGEKAFDNTSAPPSVRISSAYHAGIWRAAGDPTQEEKLQAARLLAGAVDLLPLLSPKDLQRIDQQSRLQRFNAYGLVSDAAALALEIGSLKQVEGCHIMDCRTDISDLQETFPELAGRFDTLRNYISRSEEYLKGRLSEESAGSNEGMPSALRLALHRVQLNDSISEFDQTIKEIRSKRGFEGFLSPLLPEELRTLSADGYLVIVNVSQIRCDAITVSQGKTCVVPLPGLKLATLEDKENSFRLAIKKRKNAPDTARETLLGILKWLWDVCAKPILDSLGLCGPCHTRDKTRLWWVLGGVLGRLPLHACGDYGQRQAGHEACTVPTLVVSSYVPTLRAATVPPTCSERVEAKILLRNNKLLVNPTYADVREELQHSSIAHFACHGISDNADPGRSYLRFRDWEDHPLNVSALMSMNLTACQLAYLSACKTADSTVKGLVDEGIHLVSGFMLAGCPSVVGTLWKIPDNNAEEIATQFYARLPKKNGILCTGHSAAALLSAVSFVREQCAGGDDPLTWAAFIHTGI
ncbi:MAG: hypothetical protein M1840_000245 [Geoglossum simile]|nr:MAG: hypothetical protein M1840_000245 [Geoglossum simile]